MPEGSWQFQGPRDQYIGPDGIIGYRGSDATGKIWRNHMSANEIRDAIGDSVWNAYFKFCIVRNPFDKLVSAFYFFERQRTNTAPRENSSGLLSRLSRRAGEAHSGDDAITRFRRWVQTGSAVIDRDKYTIDGRVCVDYFIKFEELHQGIQHVCDVLDIAFQPDRIPHLKTGIRKREIPLHEYYDEATAKIVEEIYKFELETFGYRRPTAAFSPTPSTNPSEVV